MIKRRGPALNKTLFPKEFEAFKEERKLPCTGLQSSGNSCATPKYE
jgi:hypothetical protein